jgi:hypothetical protein
MPTPPAQPAPDPWRDAEGTPFPSRAGLKLNVMVTTTTSMTGGRQLVGMSTSTLHRIEHGQRELTLSEIVALSSAREIAPSALIRLPSLAPPNAAKSIDPSQYGPPLDDDE